MISIEQQKQGINATIPADIQDGCKTESGILRFTHRLGRTIQAHENVVSAYKNKSNVKKFRNHCNGSV